MSKTICWPNMPIYSNESAKGNVSFLKDKSPFISWNRISPISSYQVMIEIWSGWRSFVRNFVAVLIRFLQPCTQSTCTTLFFFCRFAINGMRWLNVKWIHFNSVSFTVLLNRHLCTSHRICFQVYFVFCLIVCYLLHTEKEKEEEDDEQAIAYIIYGMPASSADDWSLVGWRQFSNGENNNNDFRFSACDVLAQKRHPLESIWL